MPGRPALVAQCSDIRYIAHVNKSLRLYQTGAAADYVDDRLAAGFVSFSLDDLVAHTGLSVIAARNQLLRLGDKVVGVSPRQQYFLIVTPEHRSFGAPPVDWWLGDYMQWLGHPYYLALQSAATAFGSSQQAIQETQVITDTQRRGLTIGRIRIRFFMKSGAKRTLVQELPGADAPLMVSTPESTLIDLVRHAHKLGGIERVAETMEPLLPTVKTGSLHRALATEAETATAQRLGFILEVLGAGKLVKAVRAWLPANLAPVLLSTHVAGDRAAPPHPTWLVINNGLVFR